MTAARLGQKLTFAGSNRRARLHTFLKMLIHNAKPTLNQHLQTLDYDV